MSFSVSFCLSYLCEGDPPRSRATGPHPARHHLSRVVTQARHECRLYVNGPISLPVLKENLETGGGGVAQRAGASFRPSSAVQQHRAPAPGKAAQRPVPCASTGTKCANARRPEPGQVCPARVVLIMSDNDDDDSQIGWPFP